MAIDPITAALDIGSKLIDKLWPDPTQRDQAKLQLLTLQQNGELAQMTGQLNVNIEEAKNANWFVAGWRPYIGWVCGTGLGYQFIFAPVANGLLHSTQFPNLDTSTLLQLLVGMLGMGALRTYEKYTGTEGNRK